MLCRASAAGHTTDYFNWDKKLDWLTMVARPLGMADLAALAIVCALLAARRQPADDLFAQPRRLDAVPPDRLHPPAEDRLARLCRHATRAYLFAIALVAIRFPNHQLRLRPARWRARVACCAHQRAGACGAYDRELAASTMSARRAAGCFVGRLCVEPWAMSRLFHLPGLAIVRRQWAQRPVTMGRLPPRALPGGCSSAIHRIVTATAGLRGLADC